MPPRRTLAGGLKARAVLEIEGQEKPAYVAEPLTLCFV